MTRWYLVESAEYGTVIPVLDYGQGPTEWGRDVLYVRARSAARAKVLMVRAFRRRIPSGYRWKKAPWLDDGNPFRGMKAVRCDSLDWASDTPDEAADEASLASPHGDGRR